MRQKILFMIVIFTLIMAFTGCNASKTPPEPKAEIPDTKIGEDAETGNAKITAASETEITSADSQSEVEIVQGNEQQEDEQQANPDTLVSEDFMMQIEDVFSITGRGTVATGKILSGQVSVNAEVELVGLADEPRTVTIGGIEVFRKLLDTAVAGDNVGILLNGLEKSDVQRGQVLAAKGFISAHNTYSADIVFTPEQSDTFFSQGYFGALSYFFTTDSKTVFYFNQTRPDENGKLSVTAQMLAKLPMKEGTPFKVLRSGTVIADGVITGVGVEITGEPSIEDVDIQDSATPTASETPAKTTNTEVYDTEASDSDVSDLDTADAGAANFVVKLLNYGDQKIQVIKVVREITGLGLKEAKDLVDNTPSIIKNDITQKEAEGIKSKLEGVGATVEITE